MSQQPDALPELRLALTVSGDFFRVMGVEPALGRSFSSEEDRVPGRDAVAVLSHDAWEQHFSADPKIIGRTVRLNNIEFKIIGVAPRRFTGIEPLVRPDLYIPIMMLPRISPASASDPDVLQRRDLRAFTIKGRLKSGLSLAQAN